MNNRTRGEEVTVAEAAQWHARQGRLDDSERKTFAEWLKASPRNLREFMIMETLADGLRQVDPQRRHDVKSLLADPGNEVIELHETAPAVAAVPASSRRRVPVWAIAAGIAVAALAVWQVTQLSNRGQSFSTAVGEQRTLQLPDNSVVNLNTGSRLEVHFTAHGRDIHLLSGEAFFKVQQDTARPFRVHTRDAVVQALGTQFNVYRRTGDTAVAVLEGRVRVTADNGRQSVSSSRSPTVSAGESLHVTSNGEVGTAATSDVELATAWRQRRLIFREDTLATIAAEFNRYNQSPRIRLEGLDGSAQRYTGTFDADNPLALALLLSRQQDLTVKHEGREIVISAR